MSKLLNRQRKLRDMKVYNEMLQGLLEIHLPFKSESIDLIKEKLELSVAREKAVNERDLKALKEVYKSKKLTRKISYICDIWLCVFGK